MKGIAKYSQECVDSTGLKRWVGLELEFEQNDKSPEEALAEVELKVSKAISLSSSKGIIDNLNLGWGPPVIPNRAPAIIQVTPEDRTIGVSVDAIMSCQDLVTLQSYKFIVRSCGDEIRKAYQERERALMIKADSLGESKNNS